MQGLHALIWGVLLVGVPLTSQGANYYRCVDAQGRVSFSDHGCPNGEALRLQPANSLPAPSPQPHHPNRGKVSGQEQALPCGGLLNAQERRTAMVRQEIRAGLSRADIESALGKPDRITRNHGLTRYQYTDRKGSTRTVRFDEHGCVMAGG